MYSTTWAVWQICTWGRRRRRRRRGRRAVHFVFSTFHPPSFHPPLVSFCSSHEKVALQQPTLRAPSWCIRQPGQFAISVRGEEEEGEKEEGGGLFTLYFPHFIHLLFIPPSFLFVLLMKRYLNDNQLSELPPGVFDNLGSLDYLYVGKKKEKKREEGCSFCIFHISSTFFSSPPRFLLFFS